MGRSACLLTHGVMCGGTSDAVALGASAQITYSPNTVTNKKPALGGLGCLVMLREMQAYSPRTTTKSAGPLEYTQEQSEDCLLMMNSVLLRSLRLQSSYSPHH